VKRIVAEEGIKAAIVLSAIPVTKSYQSTTLPPANEAISKSCPNNPP